MSARACLALVALAATARGLDIKAEAVETKDTLMPFNVKFDLAIRGSGRAGDVQNASFKVRIHPEWASGGAAQFKRLAEEGWYDGAAFFRVVDGFVAQFGIPATPHPEPEKIRDDPVKRSNKRGTIVFATSGPNTRTAQLFINLHDNSFLDSQGFAPFGEVLGSLSMGVVDQIYKGYGERPDQGKLAERGNRYLDAEFPMLTKISKVTVQA
ncbi:unnamed protein product [Prorocentrum cordatum]|uniref:Peptidyl-prolyl cis-trans isomerase n=1 Tax=Prorocentrum cordatum TaxID=2364126 RepID=A0ABN9UL67_9DINO|nr:unnamed protein product [Polarella glacialis]|mmetsp:Transcript_31120/g.82816  ORF Transcript_31120/g.82816 Transcript_31120/m.82816 type:complete len:211 (-) Transcript_31120:59-691(-)